MDYSNINTLEDFARQLRLSVDSRIQHIEYNMSKTIMPYVPQQNHNHRSDGFHRSELPSFESPKLLNEKLFEMIEIYSKKIGLLIYIRAKITSKNAVRVNKMLETEAYINWNKKELTLFLDKQIAKPSSVRLNKDLTRS